ncbi:MAG: glycosyl transferase [Oscillospiraceae bacterium]|nr:glycosyl transferase [Oscillospiraceae bacterium]
MSIPKIIHYCWFGGGEIPERDQKCIASWKKYCPDYEIIQWNEDNYDVTQIPYMKAAYDAKRWGFVPDYIRMDVVHRYGGIYMDTDVELIRPLDELLHYGAYAGVEADSNCINFGLGYGAEPGHPLLRELCDHYKTLEFQNEDGSLNLTPNPIIVTEYLKKRKDVHVVPGEIREAEGLTLLPSEYLCPQNFTTGKTVLTDKTFSIHHYHASWQTAEEIAMQQEYRKFTRLFGERLGELMYHGCKTFKEKGIVCTFMKIVRRRKK